MAYASDVGCSFNLTSEQETDMKIRTPEIGRIHHLSRREAWILGVYPSTHASLQDGEWLSLWKKKKDGGFEKTTGGVYVHGVLHLDDARGLREYWEGKKQASIILARIKREADRKGKEDE